MHLNTFLFTDLIHFKQFWSTLWFRFHFFPTLFFLHRILKDLRGCTTYFSSQSFYFISNIPDILFNVFFELLERVWRVWIGLYKIIICLWTRVQCFLARCFRTENNYLCFECLISNMPKILFHSSVKDLQRSN